MDSRAQLLFLGLIVAQAAHSIEEFRFVTFGVSREGRLLAVSHEEEGEVIRIISARWATRSERKIYEEG